MKKSNLFVLIAIVILIIGIVVAIVIYSNDGFLGSGKLAKIKFYNQGTTPVKVKMIAFSHPRFAWDDINGREFVYEGQDYVAGQGFTVEVPSKLANDLPTKTVRVRMLHYGMNESKPPSHTEQTFNVEDGKMYEVKQVCWWPKEPCSTLTIT